ncbi:hypothetical protein SPRG_18774 [Saprolegnia parasitica CBS 223.65]|uniref:SAM domain-containing protein n=1 Tax=Saprolegnia parasitica (strain CBS 223.65) TaxID=695850 RepID=A0A067D1C4_SAPPC|nr:hypothetical protein SPRG_18774 [Saprolegnia parasitica CBS 223.65]KDO35285.1 hypothetical protein SPRG_18774 [Saprolegnia parasitica CBS 223.65]|eukprot:XP_012194006.1 hypothetical protein SPRG_18774 [Saprolegnia parasitica CBS 223.65]
MASPGQRRASAKSMVGKRVGDWTSDDVMQWLHTEGLAAYESLFLTQETLNGEFLLEFSTPTLDHMGITSLKQRKELLKAIHSLQVRALEEVRASPRTTISNQVLEPEFNEDASHASFLEALQAWRQPSQAHVDHGTATSLPTVCWHCLAPCRQLVPAPDARTVCSKRCLDALIAADTQAREAVASQAAAQRARLQATWSLDIQLQTRSADKQT